MDNNVIVIESLECIATRVPPGSQWKLEYSGKVIDGLELALTLYFRHSKFKGSYKLDPIEGRVYAIHTEKKEVIPEPEMVWDLYGEDTI